MKKRILVLGAKGMLGHDLMGAFSGEDLVGLDIDDLDVTVEEQARHGIEKIRPNLVVNAAAFTNVDACEKNRICFEVNEKAVGNIARACAAIDAKLVHISTDYVFDGRNHEGYDEKSKPNPINMYGKSKYFGELQLFEYQKSPILVRTSWLFGKHGKNFVETILRLSKEKEEIGVVNDQFGCPTFTLDLAGRIRAISKDFCGIYHVTNDGVCSWYDLAKETVRLSGNNCKVNPITTDQYPLPAKRPECSVLINTKLKPMRPWQEALKHYMDVRR